MSACRSLTAPGDAAAAREVVAAAGELLLEIRARLHQGVAAEVVRRQGDRQSSDLIVSLLRQRFPADAVLSEESIDVVGPRAAGRVWIVDPLDGTREFGELGRSDWAVHVALVEGGSLRAGAVALPAQGAVTFCSDDASVHSPRRAGHIRVVTSRTRAVPEAHVLASRLKGDLIRMGSAGAKVAAVLRGDADVYVHSGGQYVWDSAAPVAVAKAFGLHASRLDGSPIEHDPEVPWLPDLVVCRADLRDAVLSALGSVRFAQPRI